MLALKYTDIFASNETRYSFELSRFFKGVRKKMNIFCTYEHSFLYVIFRK